MAIDEELLFELPFRLEPQRLIDVDGPGVVPIDDEIELVQVEHVEGVRHRLEGCAPGIPLPLMGGGDDDLEFGAAMDAANVHQLHQPHLVARHLEDEAALMLVVDVLVIELGQLHVSLVRLLEPVAHDAGVVVELMNELEILALEGTKGQGVGG